MENKQIAVERKPFLRQGIWPIIFIAVVSAIVGGGLVWIIYNSGLDEQLSDLRPGSGFSQNRHMKNVDLNSQRSIK